MSVEQSIRIKVPVQFASQEELDSMLVFCKERFGHRGKDSGWWWRYTGKTQRIYGCKVQCKSACFLFKKPEDALAFKIIRG